MLFDQFLRRFSFFIADKNAKPKRLLLNPSKDESARLNLEKANKLIAANKHKKALELIDQKPQGGHYIKSTSLKRRFCSRKPIITKKLKKYGKN